jgi:guanylate kinase
MGELVKRPRGRPVGTKTGTQTVRIIRDQFEKSLGIIEKDKNKTLADLLAEGLTESTASMNQTLNTIAKFLPTSAFVDVQVSGGHFADALSQAAEIIRSESAHPIVIDQDEKEQE